MFLMVKLLETVLFLEDSRARKVNNLWLTA